MSCTLSKGKEKIEKIRSCLNLYIIAIVIAAIDTIDKLSARCHYDRKSYPKSPRHAAPSSPSTVTQS